MFLDKANREEGKAMRDEFGGYYFKAQSDTQTVAVIVAYHRSKGSESASVQIISDDGVWSAVYPEGGYHKTKKGFRIRLDKNIFTEKGMHLDIHHDGLKVTGKLRFGALTPIKYDIMGPFAAVPFMECRHTVVSMTHRVDGCICINGERYTFKNALGYIEGDRGYSFPSVYAWTQCLFDGGSLMLSVADIPIGPVHFTGIIGVVYLDGKEHRIATYLGARPVSIKGGRLVVKQGKYELTAQLIEKHPHPLAAPVAGEMSRTIHESASCKASYKLTKGGKTLLDITSDRATFEYEYPL